MGGFALFSILICCFLPARASDGLSCMSDSDRNVSLTSYRQADLPDSQDRFFMVKRSMCSDPGIFNTLEVGLNVGTSGLGFQIMAPVSRWVRLRLGLDWIPEIKVPMSFGITAYTDNGAVNDKNFNKVQEMMKDLTGFEMDDRVRMDARPTMLNFKFLVDVFPIPRNDHWYVTAGFYAGGRRIGKARNEMEEMPSLLMMGMYNRLYEYFTTTDFMEEPVYQDFYLDPDVADKIIEKLETYGRLGVHMGDFVNVPGVEDGTPYMMEPDKDGMVKASAYVNAFKPYVGLGYTGAVSRDKRWKIGFDAGAMLWGGMPNVITHEGVDMSYNLEHVPGKVGRYLKIIDAFKAYPVLNFNISYTFF